MRATVVGCGTPLTTRLASLATALRSQGWQVTAVATSAGQRWTDEEATCGDGRRPDLLVVLGSFNTITGWAAGRADSRILGLLSESLGRPRVRTRILLVPFVGTDLAGHPAYRAALNLLTEAGVELIDPINGGDGTSPIESGTGERIAGAFNLTWVTDRTPFEDEAR